MSNEITGYTYKYKDHHLDLMLEQIWEAKNDKLHIYHDLGLYEWNQIFKYVGNPKTVFEMGCGIGRGTIFLNHLLKNDDIQYVMGDRTGRTKNTGAYGPDQDEFYNDLTLTKEFCEYNNVKKVKTFDTEINDWNELPKADFIFSLCSLGMHVPVKRYIDKLISISNPNTTMVFGTRYKYSYSENSFKDLFDEVEYHEDNEAMSKGFPQQNWLILKKPKVL
jgi:hypothetical protein